MNSDILELMPCPSSKFFPLTPNSISISLSLIEALEFFIKALIRGIFWDKYPIIFVQSFSINFDFSSSSIAEFILNETSFILNLFTIYFLKPWSSLIEIKFLVLRRSSIIPVFLYIFTSEIVASAKSKLSAL